MRVDRSRQLEVTSADWAASGVWGSHKQDAVSKQPRDNATERQIQGNVAGTGPSKAL